jgi:hypothetical protein
MLFSSMPITYYNDIDRRIVFEAWSGEIHASDMREHFTRLLQDPVSISIRRSIGDARQAVPHVTAEDVEQIIEEVVLPGLNGRSWVSAAVVATSLHLRLARRYQVAQNLNEVAVFSDFDAALSWLLRQEPPT